MRIATKGFAVPGDRDSNGEEKAKANRCNGWASFRKLATWVRRNSEDILDFLDS